MKAHAVSPDAVADKTPRQTKSGGCDMRAEMTIATIAQVSAFAGAQAIGAPESTIRLLAILAGCFCGSMVSAMAQPRASSAQRARRFVLSLFSGALLSVIALAFWPQHASFAAHDWIFVVAGLSAFGGYWVVVRADKRADSAAQDVVDRAASKLSLDREHKS